MRKTLSVRRLPALDAIEESISRATEMGRPVHFSTGESGSVYTAEGPSHLAGLTVLEYVTRLCARSGATLIVSAGDPAIFAIEETLVKEQLKALGKEESYKTGETVRFFSGAGYRAAVMGLIQSENVASNILVGRYESCILSFAEAGAYVGAMQIGGTDTTCQLPFFVTALDYCLIGEDIFAISAYVTKSPLLIGSLAGEDVAKVISIILIIIGTILITGGNNVLLNLL